MSIRTERVASVIREALSSPLSTLGKELDAGFVTVTHVRMSKDLRHAKVYLSVFGGKTPPEQALKKIEFRAPEIRRELGRNIRLRFTPELQFFLDDTLENMERIQQLLKDANSD